MSGGDPESPGARLTPVIDWNVAADSSNIRPGSIELQQVVHREWFQKISGRPAEKWLRGKPYWRATCIEKLEVRLGHKLRGNVLEVGAGTALCSALASKRPDVELVTAMDYDHFCVEEMMPFVFNQYGANTGKIERVYGSYNRILRSGFYDYIIAVGALHHSEDLTVTLRALHSALKPGGVVMISDVCETDAMTTRSLAERYESNDPRSEERYGRVVKLKENGDHWYRLSEWMVAAWNAGFESLPYVFDHQFGLLADDEIFRAPKPYFSFGAVSYQPYFAKQATYDQLLLFLQKSDEHGRAPITDGVAVWTSEELAIALGKKGPVPSGSNNAPSSSQRRPKGKPSLFSRISARLKA